jgi:hypothetical protein
VIKEDYLSFHGYQLDSLEAEAAWQAKMDMELRIERGESIAPMLISEERNYKPYKSMVTGEMIEGRKAHRDHLIRHNVVEVGNEVLKPKPKELPSGLKERLWEVTNSKL